MLTTERMNEITRDVTLGRDPGIDTATDKEEFAFFLKVLPQIVAAAEKGRSVGFAKEG